MAVHGQTNTIMKHQAGIDVLGSNIRKDKAMAYWRVSMGMARIKTARLQRASSVLRFSLHSKTATYVRSKTALEIKHE